MAYAGGEGEGDVVELCGCEVWGGLVSRWFSGGLWADGWETGLGVWERMGGCVRIPRPMGLPGRRRRIL